MAAGTPTVWQLLALSDPELEKANLVVLNLVVAREIPTLAHLDVARYVRIVDDWTQRFARWMPAPERAFSATPWKWKSDLLFFRVAMLQGFLGQQLGIRYIDEQKHAATVRYTDPADLFLHGVIDTKRGTCANMAALHVAISRRMGWPVGLACAKSHLLSRFDDGQVVHNIEASSAAPGVIASGSDEDYVKRFDLPRRAIVCGSDLRKLTTREMLGVFLGQRARHYMDTQRFLEGDESLALARCLFPRNRRMFVSAVGALMRRGATLFVPGELGCPESVAAGFGLAADPVLPDVPVSGMQVVTSLGVL